MSALVFDEKHNLKIRVLGYFENLGPKIQEKCALFYLTRRDFLENKIFKSVECPEVLPLCIVQL